MQNEQEILKRVEKMNNQNSLEKHVQTFLVTIITGTCIGIAALMLNLKEGFARMEEREKAKSEQINDMQAIMKNLQSEVRDLKVRMDRMEIQNAKK